MLLLLQSKSISKRFTEVLQTFEYERNNKENYDNRRIDTKACCNDDIDSRMAAWATEIASLSQRRIYYGIDGIAKLFGCSVPTANRIKKSGVIDDAITQIDRQIVIDGNLALALAKKAGTIKIKGETKTVTV